MASATGVSAGDFNRAKSSVAAERNTAPIVEVVTRLLAGARGRALEVASGTGQHVAALADALPDLEWQPSEVSADAFESIVAHAAGRANVRPPLLLDAASSDWRVSPPLEAVFVVNVTHITAWRVTQGLLAGAAAALRPGGLLLIYGPFLVDGKPTTESNASFDASLRATNPAWGYRDKDVVAAEAAKSRLQLAEVATMPANNFMLVFRKD